MALDILSYEIGKKAGGGSQPINLQDKEITITENGEQTITADSGYDGLNSVEVTTNVSSGIDWSDIGYNYTPEYIQDVYTYSKQIYDNWDANNPHNFRDYTNLVICPFIDTSKISGGMISGYMFAYCKNLREIPALEITNNVDNLWCMFQGCENITKLDLSNFDTSNVDNMMSMFYGCKNLTTIIFGNNFIPSKLRVMNNIFGLCTKLDNNTLNAILGLCINTTSKYTGQKTLAHLGITSSFINYANIPNLSNYQAFLDAGWTIS